jgi:hypothetical protein
MAGHRQQAQRNLARLLQYKQRNCRCVELAFVLAVLNLCLVAGVCKATESYLVTRILSDNCGLSQHSARVGAMGGVGSFNMMSGPTGSDSPQLSDKILTLHFCMNRAGCVCISKCRKRPLTSSCSPVRLSTCKNRAPPGECLRNFVSSLCIKLSVGTFKFG